MKTLLKLVAVLALVVLLNGCASNGNTSSSRGPTISGYVDTSVGAKW